MHGDHVAQAPEFVLSGQEAGPDLHVFTHLIAGVQVPSQEGLDSRLKAYWIFIAAKVPAEVGFAGRINAQGGLDVGRW